MQTWVKTVLELRSALLAAVLCGGFGAGLGAGPAAAQSWGLIASVTADTSYAGEALADHELAYRSASDGGGRVLWPTETLALLAGDGQGSKPFHWLPGDIDAIHDLGGRDIAAHGLIFSLTADENGFKDGDVLTPGPGGLQIYLAEGDLVAACGASDGNVDLDALHVDPDGTWLFSFADNENSAFLSGDDAGVIKDGDVLVWNVGQSQAQMHFTENQVSALVTQALGVSTAIGDTMSLARHPLTGAVLFTVQSPSAHDASVFTAENGGALELGFDEASWGFGAGAELDALSVAEWRFPVLRVSDYLPAAGESVVCTLRGGQPGVPYALLASLDLAAPSLVASGWGGFVLSNDGLLTFTWSNAASFLLGADGLGSAALTMFVPAALPPVDVVLQLVALQGSPSGGLETSNPVVLELAH
ncbi:MAG: hypothetical protein ACT4PU_12025 [Planctomycetota bacterium]